jgi:hypothetical protein
MTQIAHIPLVEISALAFHLTGQETGVLAAIGDRKGVVAYTSVEVKQDNWLIERRSWVSVPIHGALGTKDQWEGAAIDGGGRIVLLRESPPCLAVVDHAGDVVAEHIDLTLPDGHPLTDKWEDPASGPEALILLQDGHVLVAKEKNPAAIIEFAPSSNARPNADRNRWLQPEAAWQLPQADQMVAIATWFLDTTPSSTLLDISDAAIGPHQELYLLSDRSATIAQVRLEQVDSKTHVGNASTIRSWGLADRNNPEGLAFLPDGTALVAYDRQHPRDNLVVLDQLISGRRSANPPATIHD